MVEPSRLKLPPRRQLQGVVALAHRIRFLKLPSVLQEERLFFYLIFIADNIPRLCCRDLQDLELHIGDQFRALEGWRSLSGLFVLYFEILSPRRDAPSVNAFNLPLRIEIDMNEPPCAPIGTQNLIRLAHRRLDLVG